MVEFINAFVTSKEEHAYVQEVASFPSDMSQHTAVICGVSRTPIGRFMGALSSMSAVDLGVASVKELLGRMDINPSSGIVDEVLMGQVLQAGIGQAPARQVALGAGLPVSTSCVTINMVCGSSLKAVMHAATSIRMGEHNVVIAGGMESMSNAPQLLMGQRKGKKMGDSKLVDSMIHDGLWDVYNDMHMGNTGEVVARECSINREQADAFSVQSHKKAAKAWDEGWFDWESDGYPFWSHLQGVQSWWNYRHLPNILFMNYADMKKDIKASIEKIANFLNIEVTSDRINDVEKKISIKAMREAAETYVPDAGASWQGGAKTFINRGINGRWKDILSQDELMLYDLACDKILSPDCRDWLENGGDIS